MCIPLNVEDENDLRDFHVPSPIRRGGLMLALSTGGESHALAVALRKRLERLIGPEWAERLARAGELRRQARADGLRGGEVTAAILTQAEQENWYATLDRATRPLVPA